MSLSRYSQPLFPEVAPLFGPENDREIPLALKPVLRVKRLSPSARLPHRASAGAAGYDLFSARDVIIPARGKALISLDISVEIPSGCYGRIAPRSGLASQHFIDVGAGVIDRDYRGSVGVLLFNHSHETDFAVKTGDRIAQLILERCETPEVIECQTLGETQRNTGGFGSTGMRAITEN